MLASGSAVDGRLSCVCEPGISAPFTGPVMWISSCRPVPLRPSSPTFCRTNL